MSNDAAEPGADGALPENFARLETRVRKLLEELAGYRARAEMAEERSAKLQKTLNEVSSGDLDPVQMRERMRSLEDENEALRNRIAEAEERIRRLVARFDFLREEM